MKMFDSFMKEKQPLVFNANVFKNVQLAMDEDQVKVEEEKVKQLADFIKTTAIPNLIKNMSKNEGIPTDSQSLKDFFHQNGVNIRYLGLISESIKDQNLPQVKNIIEREVVVRCMKHLLNKYLRECESDEMLAATVAHVLNCLLAPKEFIKRMDEGQVSFQCQSVKTIADMHLLENMQKLEGPNAAAEAIAQEQEKQPMSKKEKKRQKQAAKQVQE